MRSSVHFSYEEKVKCNPASMVEFASMDAWKLHRDGVKLVLLEVVSVPVSVSDEVEERSSPVNSFCKRIG
jgi:hypothetical protein